MILTPEQRKVVEDNLGLVGKVIKDKRCWSDSGFFTYDDLFQIGCIGLCKAAATDKGGCFSTYAYRVIWNEICDALRSAARLVSMETELVPGAKLSHVVSEGEPLSRVALKDAMMSAIVMANPTERKGIESLMLMEAGYSCREIGERVSKPANTVSAWVSKARKYLRGRNDIIDVCEGRFA